MTFVCSQLSAPDATGVQSCQVWVQQDSGNQSAILPALSYHDAQQIIYGAFLILGLMWVAKRGLRIFGG